MASDPEPTPTPDENLNPNQIEAVRAAAEIGSQTWELDDSEGLLNPLPFPIPVPVPEAPPPIETPPPPPTQPAIALAVVAESVPPTPLQIVEAMLFAGGPPMTFAHVREAIRELSEFEFLQIIDTLDMTYRNQSRPYEIASTIRGYSLRLRPRFEQIRQRLFGGPREIRLSQPALDVLSIIAYRQPVAVADVDTNRGIDSMGLIRQLVRLGLVVNTGKGEQGPTYATTERFLEMFGLKDVEDLPKMGTTKKI